MTGNDVLKTSLHIVEENVCRINMCMKAKTSLLSRQEMVKTKHGYDALNSISCA